MARLAFDDDDFEVGEEAANHALASPAMPPPRTTSRSRPSAIGRSCVLAVTGSDAKVRDALDRGEHQGVVHLSRSDARGEVGEGDEPHHDVLTAVEGGAPRRTAPSARK